MEMSFTGWAVTALAILITGISKSGLGGALGGLAVPFLSIWISPRDAAAVMLPILIVMDLVGIRAWRGKADWHDLKIMIPGALTGIVIGSLTFGVMPDHLVKSLVGLIAVCFSLDRLLRKAGKVAIDQRPSKYFGWLCGAGSGFTSTLAHAGGPPVMIYLLSWSQPRETFVATTVFFFAFINLAKLPFYFGLGLFSRETLTMSLVLLPIVPIGVWSGVRLLKHIPERPFYLISTYALGLSGFKLLWDGVMV
ncbi:sulfite exporter TauE/SafE family protein [Ferribacterium limneticum]|uniref:sulfite exporter TauE/SafE family protein n=1 Tax=Ferribacterium limneticum TaxID=76259 RepID=UPI001CF97BA9|nr:sulfite exporter TauE/SafE family protein [Ferribacterium limneticum]UCV17873.1 sulfite exporter TauE/SafE family protein [Ferribacterium limneticum]